MVTLGGRGKRSASVEAAKGADVPPPQARRDGGVAAFTVRTRILLELAA